MSYADFVRKRIFEPLGMKDTGYDNTSEIVPNRAAGYELEPKGLVNASYIDMTIPHAAGALYSTTLDLMKWDTGLRDGKLLTPENYQRYFQAGLGNYSYGWLIGKHGSLTVQSHAGGSTVS